MTQNNEHEYVKIEHQGNRIKIGAKGSGILFNPGKTQYLKVCINNNAVGVKKYEPK